MRDGKAFIIEGLHLDPGLYLYEFGRHGTSQLKAPQPDAVPSMVQPWLPAPEQPSVPIVGQGSEGSAQKGPATEPPLTAGTALTVVPTQEQSVASPVPDADLSEGVAAAVAGETAEVKHSEVLRNPVSSLRGHLHSRYRCPAPTKATALLPDG